MKGLARTLRRLLHVAILVALLIGFPLSPGGDLTPGPDSVAAASQDAPSALVARPATAGVSARSVAVPAPAPPPATESSPLASTSALSTTISGTVRDSSTGLPLAGARVKTGAPGWNAEATTEASGAYSLTVPGGNWWVNATHPAYMGHGRNEIVSEGQQLSGVDFTLAPATAWVVGTVRQGGGSPMPGRHVWVNGWNWPGFNDTNADASGVYTMGLVAGTYFVTDIEEGYTLQSTPLVTVTNGQTAAGTDLMLLPNTVTVTGQVRDQNGHGLAGVHVEPRDFTTNGSLAFGTNTDGAGYYTYTFPAGTWRVVASYDFNRISSSQTVTLSPGEIRSGVNFTVNLPNSTIAGTVRDASTGLGIPGATVDAGIPGFSPATTTDASGAYTLTVNPAGWAVTASSPGYMGASRQVSVVDGQALTGVDFSLIPAPSVITGTVRFTAGGGLRPWVNAWQANTPIRSGTRPDASGAYTLPVIAGTWTIGGWLNLYTLQQTPRVTIGDYQTLGGIDLVYNPNDSWIRGRLVDQIGSPVTTSVRVLANDVTTGSGLTEPAFPDASGYYTLPIAAGTWRINVAGWGGSYSPNRFPPDQTVTVASGQVVSGVNFTITVPRSTIAGTVRDSATGLPVAGVNVDLQGRNCGSGCSNFQVTTDASGAYSATVNAGTFEVIALANGYLRAARTVSVADGQQLLATDFSLTPAHSVITGTVRYSGGGIVPNQWVSVWEQIAGQNVGAGTDASGVYTISVTPGTRTLNATRTGFTLRETPRVTIGDYQTIGGVDLVFLPDNATVTGRVVDQQGTPVTGTQVMAHDNITNIPVTRNYPPDASGNYTLPVASGTWQIMVLVPQSGYLSPPNQVVTIAPGEVRSGVNFTVTALNSIIAGTVRDAATGLPVVGARVSAEGPNWGTMATTNASGAYTLTVYASGWRIAAQSAGYLRSWRGVVIGYGQRVDGIDLSLTPAHSLITGTVRYSTGGTAPKGQWVSGTEAATGGQSQPYVDASGVYSMPVTSGNWTLYSVKAGYTLRETPQVSIGDYQTIGGIDLVFLPNDAWITGRVVDQQGLPVSGARVNGADRNTNSVVGAAAYPDASGYYTLPIAAGTWRVAVAGSMTGFPYQGASQTVTVTSGLTLTGVNFTLQPLPPITVTTMLPNSGFTNHPTYATVQGSGFGPTPTVTLGSYPLTVTAAFSTSLSVIVPAGLPTGVYSLTVTNPDGRQGQLPSAFMVQVPPPPQTIEVRDLRLSNVSDVSFALSWATSLPVAGRVRFGYTDTLGIRWTLGTADDTWGPGYWGHNHYVVIGGGGPGGQPSETYNLNPGQTYWFEVLLEDSYLPSAAGSVRLGPSLEPRTADSRWGRVFGPDGSPRPNTMVFLEVERPDGSAESALLSARTDHDGYWYIDLSGARTPDLSARFAYTTTDRLELVAEAPPGDRGLRTVSVGYGSPIYLALYAAASRTLRLGPGWNVVALPLLPLDTERPFTVGGLAGAVNAGEQRRLTEVYRYENGQWYGVAVSGTQVSEDVFLLPGQGYFLRLGAAAEWRLDGRAINVPVPLSLQAGWNLLGLPHPRGWWADDVIAQTDVVSGTQRTHRLREIDRWAYGGYQGHMAGYPFNNFSLEDDKGYFVRSTQPFTWTPGS